MDRELVLVGGGHAHALVLADLAARRLEGFGVSVVSDAPVSWYSGMVPAWVAGRVAPEALRIDVAALAARAGARWVEARVAALDPATRRIHLAGGGSLTYDLASFNIGATVAGCDLPGVRAHALATRPLDGLVRGLAELDDRVEGAARRGRRPPVVVVGGGAAGVELALAVAARWGPRGAAVTVIEAGEALLAASPRGLRRRAARALDRRGVAAVLGARVASVEVDAVSLEGGRRLPSVATVWATGAAARRVFADSGVAVDDGGYAFVGDDLRLEGVADVFAVGDCARQRSAPWTPRAGVYAVRQAAVLTRNLRAVAAGRPTAAYRPQRDFLRLLDRGDGGAIGAKWGIAFEGAWVGWLKRRIDGDFVGRFA